MVVVVAEEVEVVEGVEVAGRVVVVSVGFSFGSLNRLQWKSRESDEAVEGCRSLFHRFSLSDFSL